MRNLSIAVFSLLMSCTSVASQGQKCDTLPPAAASTSQHNVQVKKKIYVDSKFAKDELAVISAAAKEWSEASDGIVEYDVVPGFKLDPSKPPPSKIILLRLKSTDSLTSDLKIDDEVASGVMVIPGTVVIFFVMDRITDKTALKLHAMRVLGSEMGVPTISGKYAAVMNIDMEVNCLTKYDMILFCTKYVCDWRDTNFCEEPKKTKNKIDL